MPERLAATNQLDRVRADLEQGRLPQVRAMLGSLHPAEIASLLEAMPHGPRGVVWELVDPHDEGEVLLHVSDEVREQLIERTDNADLVVAVEGMAVDDLADLIDDLPEAVTSQVLQAMSHAERQVLEAVRQYPEDTAGGLMDADIITVRADVTLDVVIRYLRMRGSLPNHTDTIFVTDRYGRFSGSLSLADLITQDPDLLVREMMNEKADTLQDDTPDSDVAKLFENRDLISAPVVDVTGRLIGRITIDDVVDVIRDEAEHSILSMAGLDEEDDMFAPAVKSAQRRAVWLGINLVTALLAALVVDSFTLTIQTVAGLAALMPVVASMGGITGSQTLTLIIRGLALGQVSGSNLKILLMKEMAIGTMNGLIWGFVVGLIALGRYEDGALIGAVAAAAVILNMIFGALAGLAVPVLLKKLNVDPALAGSVILTTITDVVGFFVLLGLASVVLM